MRINGSDQVQRVGATTKVELRSVGDVQQNRSTDNSAVVVADRAAKLNELRAEDESIHESRLAEIKRQLDEGTYTIDLDLLAERLVDEELAPPGGSE